MTYQSSTNLYQNSRYVVSNVAGATPYQTIQSAINAANAAGGNATIFIRSGTYTENLTLYSTVNLEGAEASTTIITGVHTPPNAGSTTFSRIGFVSASDVINSAAAGTTTFKFARCNFSITNGYVLNVANWTGAILMKYCNEGASTTNGIINNTGTSQVDLINNTIGAGTAKSLTVNGAVTIFNNRIGCPIALSGNATSVFDGGCALQGTVTVTGNANLTIANSRIVTGVATALVASSTLPVLLSNVSINTTNAIAINGTGSVSFAEATFPQSNVVAGTVTQILTGVVKTGENYSNTILRMDMSGFYSWAAAGPYFDDTTLGTFQLLVGGTGYIRGKVISWVAQNITGMTAGNTYWIYIDSTGTIGKASARTDQLFIDNIVLFQCMRDSTAVTNNQVTVKENHPYNFQTSVSNYDHDVIGSVIENVNNGANIVLVGTQGIGISGADVYSDHGLSTTIPDSGGLGVTWIRMFTLASGKWARQNATTTFTGYWNNAGTATALTAGRWGVYRLYVCKDSLNATTPTYFAVLDVAQYGSLNAARNAIIAATPAQATNELLSLEVAQLGYIIYRESTATIVEVTISKATLRSTMSTGSSNTASLVNTDVTNFNNVLSTADTNVQSALDTIDDFGSGTGNQTVNLYTGAAVKTVTLGSTNTTSATTIQGGSTGMSITTATANGPLTVRSGTGTINMGDDATAQSINVGTGAGVKTVTLGSTNTTSVTTLQAGSVGMTITTATGNGPISIVSGTGTIGIATSATNSTVNVATGAGVKTTTLGSTNSTSATTVQAGSTGLTLTTATANGPITIASGTGQINLAASATNSTVNLGTGAGVKTVTLGSTNSTSSLALQYGTTGFTLASATGTVINATSAGAVTRPLQPMFQAYLSATASNATGDGTVFTIICDTENFDQGGNYAHATGIFTAPVTGKYCFNSNIYTYDMAAAHNSYLISYVSTALTVISPATNAYSLSATGTLTFSSSVIIPMTAADTCYLTLKVSGGNKVVEVYGANGYGFAGYLL